MGSIQFNDSDSSLVIVTFEGDVDDRQFEGYLARLDTLLQRKAQSAVVIDATHAVRSAATQRRKQADWMKKNETLLRAYSAGTAFVIRSPLVRGGLTAILWLQALPTPFIVVATLAEAERWARAQLHQATQGAA